MKRNLLGEAQLFATYGIGSAALGFTVMYAGMNADSSLLKGVGIFLLLISVVAFVSSWFAHNNYLKTTKS